MESVSKTRDFYTIKRSLSYYVTHHSNVAAIALSQLTASQAEMQAVLVVRGQGQEIVTLQ